MKNAQGVEHATSTRMEYGCRTHSGGGQLVARLAACRLLISVFSLTLALASFSSNALAAQVKVAWDAVTGATGYKLYYGQSSKSYSATVDVKNVTSYTVPGLGDGVRYYFAVTAYNATATSNYSSEISTVTSGTPAAAPVAGFTATPTSGTAPVTVNFTDTSTGSPTAWSWTFGDGGTSSSKNPSYTYTTAGTYSVTLTAIGSGGSNTTTKTNYITVSASTSSSGTGSAGTVNGLVAAYGFEEPTGTQTTIDASGSGNLGTISGATRITTTQFGKALSFSGTNNWVTINDSASLDLTIGMTLEAWVYPTSLNGWKTVLMKEQTGFASYWLYANDDASRPADVVNIGGTLRQLSAGSHLPTNTWTHLAATYDGSTQKLYVNGVLVGSRSQTGAIALSSGALRIGGNSVWGEYFTGYIDEVRVYNRALTSTEITADSKLAVVGLVLSTSASRSNSTPLNGASVSGNIYVSYTLIGPTAAAKPAKLVKFWLDDPKPTNPTGAPKFTDSTSPFDFAGTNSDGTARAFSTTGLSKGVHTITAQVTLSDGTILPYITGTVRIP